jgi:ethanolamine ammonia-lyase small subunit
MRLEDSTHPTCFASGAGNPRSGERGILKSAMANLPIPVAYQVGTLQSLRTTTPARVFVGRHGPALPTHSQLGLRLDHAVARDAVHEELDLVRDFSKEFIEAWQLFEVQSQATSKLEYLMQPELGRRLCPKSKEQILLHCKPNCDLQIVIGDGLSPLAVAAQVPRLLPALISQAKQRGWMIGQAFLVRYCRVGIMNDIGELLSPTVVVLLIGERPGLACADSLSAYMAYRPEKGHTDAHRNLISNIHSRGVQPEEAALRIVALADKMRHAKTSGVELKEDMGNAKLSCN